MGAIDGWVILILAGLLALGIGISGLSRNIRDRIYPNGNEQTLVTKCQVDTMIKTGQEGIALGVSRHYIMKDNVITLVKILDNSKKDEVKVGEVNTIQWTAEDNHYRYSIDKEYWIPRNQVYKYYTTQELSEIINKNKGIKK